MLNGRNEQVHALIVLPGADSLVGTSLPMRPKSAVVRTALFGRFQPESNISMNSVKKTAPAAIQNS